MAAALLPGVPARPGSRLSAFHFGLAATSAATVLAMLLVVGGAANPVALVFCALAANGGLFLYEQA
jgi:hypothetical protein